MFLYQKEILKPLAEACPEDVFFGALKAPETKHHVDNVRTALKYAQKEGGRLPNGFKEEYDKFVKMKSANKKTGASFAKKTRAEKLKDFAKFEKDKLPAALFQASGYDVSEHKKWGMGTWVSQPYVHLSGLCVADIDHVDRFEFGGLNFELCEYIGSEEKRKEVHEKISNLKSQFSKLGIVYIYITPSGYGLKIVFKADVARGNLMDNILWLQNVLGVECDPASKDASRRSYLTTENDILFIDKSELFNYENKEFSERYTPLYRDGHSQATGKSEKVRKGEGENAQTTPGPSYSGGEIKSFKGVPYETIIEEWWKQNGGVPQEGERNVKLYQLAVSLRAICDNSKSLVLSVIPRLGLDDLEVERIVESACKEPPKGVSKAMQLVLNRVLPLSSWTSQAAKPSGGSQKGSEQAPDQTTPNPSYSGGEIDSMLWEWGAQIEALFPYFPMLQDACKGLKRNQYPAALVVSGAFAMTLMTRCRYSFYHRPEELRRLNSSALIIGDPASGKSFATRLYKLLTAPILAADRVGKDAINAYREQMKTKGANKEKPKKPKVTIRIHPARTSNAQFIQDMVNAVEEVDGEPMQLHMLTFDTELDNTLSIQKGGSWIDKQTLELKAFHNEEDGQFYTNLDSVIENFIVTWNYVYTGTPLALKNKVNDRNFGSGLPTRLTCIPLPATNFQMLTRESTLDVESDKRIAEWAKKLDKTKGILPFGKIVDELFDWTARRMADAEENNSKAEEMLLKRCAYHAINFSAPFIVMRHWGDMKQDGEYWHGEFETDEIDWKLAELIVNMQYACQRHYFLAMAEKYFDDQLREISVNAHRADKTIEAFDRLPEEFTTEDVMVSFSLASDSAARSRVSRLVKDNLVIKSGEYKENGTTKSVYKKTGRIMR